MVLPFAETKVLVLPESEGRDRYSGRKIAAAAVYWLHHVPNPFGVIKPYAEIVPERTEEPLVFLSKLAVDPDYKGNNIGSEFLFDILKDVGGRGYSSMSLFTGELWPARTWYEKEFLFNKDPSGPNLSISKGWKFGYDGIKLVASIRDALAHHHETVRKMRTPKVTIRHVR